MKSIAIVVLLSFIGTWSSAQEKKGFVGVAIGTSHLLNTTQDNIVGANLNLTNAGYEIKNGFGLTLKWLGSSHTMSENATLGYGAMLVGPMYTIHLSKDFLLDIRFQPGLTWVVEKFKVGGTGNPPLQGEGNTSTTSIGFSSGLSLRYNFAKSWTAMLLSDYNNARSSGVLIKSNRLKTLSVNLGIGFRI